MLRALVLAIAISAGIGLWMAPPAHADVVTWGLDRVKHNKVVLHKAEKHLAWAQRHHYRVAGLHRWLESHLTSRKLRHQLQISSNRPHSLTTLMKRLARTEYKLQHWPKVRARLLRKVHYKRAKVVGMTQWVQGIIAKRAAAQAARADDILAQLATLQKQSPGAKDDAALNTPGARAVKAALTQLGVPYVWGGATPGQGFDCSGLVQWAWGQQGVSLVHFAATQATEGTTVALADLQPGDLVFFEKPIGHVAMYVGSGTLIEATHTGDVVRLTRLDDSWHVAEFQTATRPG